MTEQEIEIIADMVEFIYELLDDIAEGRDPAETYEKYMKILGEQSPIYLPCRLDS